jgi:hypothetical protein
MSRYVTLACHIGELTTVPIDHSPEPLCVSAKSLGLRRDAENFGILPHD